MISEVILASLDWTTITAVATAVAALAASAAAVFSFQQVKAARESVDITADTAQSQLFDNIFRAIQTSEHDFYSKQGAANPQEKELRDRTFFNTINYLAFLLKTKTIKKQKYMEFYRDAFLYWWSVFEREVPKTDRDDPNVYPEFKQMVDNIKIPPPEIKTVSSGSGAA